MSNLLARWFFGAFAFPLILLSLIGVVHAGQEPVEKKETTSQRVDAFGDPLPEAALARLGTTRFRANGFPSGVAVSPDGKTVAVANRGSIALLNLNSGKEIQKLKAGEGFVAAASIAFSPDGKVVASQDLGGSINVWNVETGELTKQVKGARGGMTARPALSADGKVLASGTEFGQPATVNVWDAKSGESLGSFTPLQNHQVRVTVSSDGKTVASWGQYIDRDPAKPNEARPAQTVQLWDLSRPAEISRLHVCVVLSENSARGHRDRT
jgi:WD40 repeat protein